MTGKPDVVVVGAGVFGAWTAFHLHQQGVQTLLVDAWEPGHLRATSSGESRVHRMGYGPRQIYTRWAWEALGLWKHWEKVWGVELFHRLGALWLFEAEDDYTRASLAALAQAGIPAVRLEIEDFRQRFPQISPQGLSVVYFELEAGALEARKAVGALFEAYRAAGGAWRLGRVEPPGRNCGRGGRLQQIQLADGKRIETGTFVFACGPWLPKLFPEHLGNFIRVTRQEVFYFGVPPGDGRFSAGVLPVWLAEPFYGIPALAGRGFKIAATELGPPFDPDTGDRIPSEEGVARARDYLALRFPALKYAPLLEARVCQYEATRDGHLLLDRHPEWENVWLVGGGSGHGFKLGPKVGEVVAAQVITGETPVPPGRRVPEELKLRPRPPAPKDNPTY